MKGKNLIGHDELLRHERKSLSFGKKPTARLSLWGFQTSSKHKNKQ